MMKKKRFNRIIGVGLIAAMMFSGNVCIYAKDSDNNRANRAGNTEQSKENYVIDCGNKHIYNKVCNVVNEEAAVDSVILEENNIIAMQLSEDVKERIADLGASVEYDECVEGNSYNGKEWKNYNYRDNWNMRSMEVVPEEKDDSKEKIKIAVIDSGIYYNENINVVERKNFLDDEASPLYEDNTGHGTAIAGIIASDGYGNTVKGINPNVQIYSARVLDSSNKAPISRIVEAIYWAIDNDVKIINMSFGTATYSKALHNAVKEAEKRGILMFAASGNEGKCEDSDVEYPAAFKEVVGVGAASKDGKLSEITSTGKELELIAPGEDINSVGWLGMDVICNGTSMAVPHAVGAASLLWQKDITKPAQFIRELMKASSKTITDDNGDKFSYIDYAYAEKIYDDLCKSYKKKGNAVKPDKKYKNNGKIKSFEGEVEARWSKANHEKTVEYASNHAGGLTANQVNIVKVGVRAPDIYYGASDYEGLKMFHAMKQNNPDGSVCFFNYVKVYEDIMNMALKCKKDGIGAAQSLAFPDGSSGVYSECVTARNYLRKQELTVMLNQAGYEYSSKNGALVLMGISMHVVGDAYAHRAYIFNGNGGYIRPDTDNIASYEERFSCAKKSCADVLGLWNGACPPSFAEFIVSGYNGVFGLEKLYTFAMQSWNGIDFYSYEASLRKRSCKD